MLKPIFNRKILTLNIIEFAKASAECLKRHRNARLRGNALRALRARFAVGRPLLLAIDSNCAATSLRVT
jgi:hypothetical protein